MCEIINSNLCVALYPLKISTIAFLLQRKENAKSIIVGHLNINSIKNKFILAESIVKAFDFFLISESKLDSTFPMDQFHIFCFNVFRRDRNRFGAALILYINENIPCRPRTFSNLELIAIEIYQNKSRWVLIGIYNPPSQSNNEFTNRLSLIIDYYLLFLLKIST